MKYSNNLVAKFCEELKKVPNIKYVCKKLGINRCTFYRWRTQHHFFEKSITDAMFIGRESINDSAESVIINGVQNGDMKCATYWLSHNHDRYIAVERVPYHQYLHKQDVEFLKQKTPNDYLFDLMFEHHYMMEDQEGKEVAYSKIKGMVESLCRDDKELIDIYYATYAEYAHNRTEHVKKLFKSKEDG